MKNYLNIALVISTFIGFFGHSQESNLNPKTIQYSTIKEAIANPKKIISLKINSLSELQTIKNWQNLGSLENLSLENDHLTQFPNEILQLKSLKFLNLSGNDFSFLPEQLVQLENLEEVYLNNETNINLNQSLLVLSKLPKLKSLHLENDSISGLPKEITYLKNLEYLYLNNNKLKEIPLLEGLDHLKYLDLKHNNIPKNIQELKNLNFGFQINF